MTCVPIIKSADINGWHASRADGNPWGDKLPRLSKRKSITAEMVMVTDQLYWQSRERDRCSSTGKEK